MQKITDMVKEEMVQPPGWIRPGHSFVSFFIVEIGWEEEGEWADVI